MGRTIFICPVPNKKTLKKAIETIFRHNASPATPTGQSYTDEEYRAFDPLRASVKDRLTSMGMKPMPGYGSSLDKWTRGENIHNVGTFVRYKNQVWLEVKNLGGGICTTQWLKRNSSDSLEWNGSEGKPDGFYNAPMLCDWMSFADLLMIYDTVA